MTKEKVLHQLHSAKSSHVAWLQRAKMLVEGLRINEDAIPINSTACGFGKWFYSEGQQLNIIRNIPKECMRDLEELHSNLHESYMKIYKIYYLLNTSDKLLSIFGKKKTITEAENTLSKYYYDEMDIISKKLLKALDLMERRINALSIDELEKI